MKDALYEIVAAACSVPLIWAYENGKRPDSVFATINITNTNAVWPVHEGMTDDGGIRTLNATREASVRVQCYGNGADEVLDALSMALQTEAVAEKLEASNTDIVGMEAVLSAPVMFEEAYEQQAILSFRYRYTAALDEDVGLIDSVNLSINTRP